MGPTRPDTVLMSSKPYSEACERNREPIAAALDPWMGDRHRVLEIGSGTGQHAAFFAERWPGCAGSPVIIRTTCRASRHGVPKRHC